MIIEKLYQHEIQFIKFGFAGVINNIISLIVYYITVFFKSNIC